MERSLALDVAYLGVAEPGDGVAGTEFTQCVDVDTVTFNFSDAKSLVLRPWDMRILGRW